MTSDRDAIIHERKLLKQKYGVLFEGIAKALFVADPIGINFESNTDEYELVVGSILPRLTHPCTVQDVEKIIYEKFCRWFGTDCVGSREQYLPIAAKLLELWREFNQPRA